MVSRICVVSNPVAEARRTTPLALTVDESHNFFEAKNTSMDNNLVVVTVDDLKHRENIERIDRDYKEGRTAETEEDFLTFGPVKNPIERCMMFLDKTKISIKNLGFRGDDLHKIGTAHPLSYFYKSRSNTVEDVVSTDVNTADDKSELLDGAASAAFFWQDSSTAPASQRKAVASAGSAI